MIRKAVLLLSMLASPAFADQPCANSMADTEAIGVADQMIDAGASVTLRIYDGKIAKDLVAALNKEPPETALAGDEIITLSDAGPEMRIAIVVRGCVTHLIPARTESWLDMLTRVLGKDT